MSHPEETTTAAAEPGIVNQGTAGAGTACHPEDIVTVPTGMTALRHG